MKYLWMLFLTMIALSLGQAKEPVVISVPNNPAIDTPGFLKNTQDAVKHRENRRVTEEEFIRMSREPGTIILDARSKEKFDLLHIRGATHLNFSDITVESLKRVIPDPNTRILIYCNNNFKNALIPFPTKAIVAPLNLPTFVTLYSYGYRNVYELGPLLDPKSCKIEFESTKSAEPNVQSTVQSAR
ncbi:rhodanese-like domain-containing protein [Tuwongella immobilis]|uniref:Rhodanese domain-containing protein n=1 Tax=Tuwongella immobilis TaxID=692036 RepID=A0A6C2YSI8_9BACT|nr:rhodanese-like domain-containing protein [Tuwongella immobilis]VIP04307.1 Putative sulfurtransferase OS=Synechococcus sp. PCC 7502 GN=Syn7502_01034 PE=4 SV=1: Rhodanese [Tuwongella immobilis]VTS05977.1 Putative sulfurtransferase OS=Synechococcus sp. PCC 7502 GN=Syn7502_01034 PE=4 SV=1: Rhodanese [Tuwongella immobilis]